jgi:2-haloacid dehalogenase
MDKLITFDCYGTLINTDPFYNEIGIIGNELGIDKKLITNTFANYEDRLMYGESFMKYTELIYKALDYCELELNCDGIKSQYDRLIDVHKELLPFNEVNSTLHFLKENGYKTAILSNSELEIIKYNIKALNHNFDYVLLAEDLHSYKPQMEFFTKVSKIIDLPRYNHCHIAAGFWWDIVPASKLMWNKIWINRNNKKGLTQYKPYQEVKTLDEIIDYI